MRRTLLLFAIAALTAACAAPAPSTTPGVASPTPVRATPVPTSRPSPVPSPVPTPATTRTVAPIATPTEGVPEETFDPPPLEVDFDAAPTFPSPVLVVGKTRTRAIGESGCPTIIYEPVDDEFGRSAQMPLACISNPILAFAKPVRVTADAILVFRGPKGWDLGAQVVSETDPFGPFWVIEATRLSARPAGATPLVRVTGNGWVEIGRDEGFRIVEIGVQAPSDPGDYLVSVQAQMGQTPPKWRTFERTYYYWIRVF